MGKSKEFEKNKGRFANNATEVQRQIAKKGAEVMHKKRVEKKNFIERVRMLQNMTFKTKNGEEIEYSEAAAHKLWSKAINGDINAMKLIGQIVDESEKVGNNVQIVFADAEIGKSIINI